jgi:methionine-rich copper-binding protein CopC
MLHKTIASLAASVALFTSTGAFAHAAIASSSIANGGAVATTPANFGVTFSAPVRLAGVTLTNAAGAQVPMTYRGSATPAATFSVPLPRLAPGTYTMAFRAMGADGHAMAPQTTFTIGAVTAARAAPKASAMGGMDHSKMGGMGGMEGMSGMNHGGGSAMTVTTSIADGAVLTSAPTSLRVTFPHAMRLTSARLSVASGETIPVRLPAGTAPATTADIMFPRLDADSYSLTWGANAGDHTMGGTVRFRVR